MRTWNRLQSHNSAAPYACQQWRNSVRRWPMPLPSSGRRICVCLEVLLAAELEERERNTIAHRIKDARLPRMKTLEEFDFSKAPQVPATKMHDLAQGGYIERAEPVILIGATGLCLAACRQKRRVRFTTAAALVNELVEAKQQLQLRRVLARWERYDVIAIDEVGYVPMAELGAEFLFQVIAERAEKAAVILTPICRSPSGLRSYPTPASARRSCTGSPIAPTSSKPAPIASVSGGRSRKAGLNPRADRRPRCTSGFRYAPARSTAHLHPNKLSKLSATGGQDLTATNGPRKLAKRTGMWRHPKHVCLISIPTKLPNVSAHICVGTNCCRNSCPCDV